MRISSPGASAPDVPQLEGHARDLVGAAAGRGVGVDGEAGAGRGAGVGEAHLEVVLADGPVVAGDLAEVVVGGGDDVVGGRVGVEPDGVAVEEPAADVVLSLPGGQTSASGEATSTMASPCAKRRAAGAGA